MAEENGTEKPVQVFNSADRIRQLNEIDKVRPTRNCDLNFQMLIPTLIQEFSTNY